MIVRTQASQTPRHATLAKPRPPLRRRAMCQFIALALFGGGAHAATPPAFSPAWFAAKQATATQPVTPTSGAGGTASSVYTPGNVMLQQRVQQSIANLDAAAQAVAAQMSAQKSAQSAAQALVSTVPNGLGDGGLKVDSHVASDPTLWQNANAPTQSTSNGQTTVEVKQNAAKAIMSWETFNVGRQTTVHFNQTGGTRTDGSNQWIALNRVNDPTGKPSQILGQIKAEGTVYLLNRNGVIFGGGAQVDTHSLIASSLDLFSNDVSKSNAFFLKYGIGTSVDTENILGLGNTRVSLLTDNGDGSRPGAQRGTVTVEQGASIHASKDGFALIAAPAIEQAGEIVADNGQVILAAVQGLTLPNNSSGAGLSVVAPFTSTDFNGSIVNTGLIQARQGSVQWLGEDLHQDGVVVASTSLSHPGSITFDLGSAQNVSTVTTLGKGSVTTILPEKDGETTTSTTDADAAFVTSSVDFNMKAVLDPGALVEVPAGNVTFHRDAYVDTGATIDVSGLANVTLPMSALLVIIPRIGLNELANSPLLRDSFLFTAKNVAIDSTQSGTRSDGLDWVGSPVLNVAGYVNNVPRTVDQLMIRSGNIAFQQGGIVRTGAQLRLEGGFLNYLPGMIATPRLQGANGLIYDIASADPDVQYTGFAGVFTQDHARWGVTETYTNPLLANAGRWDPGFVRGGDAGTLSFGQAGNTTLVDDVVLDGDVSAHAYAGREQVRSGTEPSGGTLDINVIDLPSFNALTGVYAADAVNFVIQRDRVPLESYAPDFSAGDALPTRGGDPVDPNNPLWWHSLSTAMIDNSGLRKLRITTAGTILVKDGSVLQVANGGEVDLTATQVDVEGAIVSHGGAINLASRATDQNQQESIDAWIRMGDQARLDASGLWVNDTGRTTDELQGDHWINGGSVSLTGYTSGRQNQADITPDIELQNGAVIDVSGGGYVGTNGLLAMSGSVPQGRGGDVAIQTHVDSPGLSYLSGTIAAPDDMVGGAIDFGASLVAEGFAGGGTLTLEAPEIRVGGDAEPTPGVALLYLDPTMFSSLGFARYNLIADTDAEVTPGAQITVAPRAMLADRTALLGLASRTSLLGSSGQGDVATAGWLDPYIRYTQRGVDDGLSIQAGTYRDWHGPELAGVNGNVTVGEGARIAVDAGDTIALGAAGSVMVEGALVAHGGAIALHDLDTKVFKPAAVNRSVWLGAESLLDASGISLLDPDAGVLPGQGGTPVLRRNGVVLDGGSVQLYSDNDVVAERGSRILLSGTSDTFDLPADGRRVGIVGASDAATPVWSDAGTLDIQVTNGLYFDGRIDAHGGAAQARGGQVSIAPRISSSQSSTGTGLLVLTQDGWRLPDGVEPDAIAPLDQLDGGDLRFAVDRLDGSGVGDLYIGLPVDGGDTASIRTTSVAFAGDVSLQTGRSIQLQTTGLSAMAADARVPGDAADGHAGQVDLQAPYIAILGARVPAASPAAATESMSTDGVLHASADFIDLGGRVNLAGFGQASFDSTGDLRFTLPTADTGINQTGWLYSTGNLEFTASRLYPMTHYAFLIDAANPSSETTVTFHQAADRNGTTPLSAGGTLAVTADHIEQDGTLWVPSGSIILGTNDPSETKAALGLTASLPMAVTRDVHLASGSVTSVSLDNAIVPFGTTEDGKDWHYDNQSSTQPVVDRPPEKSVAIAGGAVSMDAGATVDLSGGGDLQAVEWVPGTGGSRDVLAQTYTDYTTSQAGVQTSQYADGRPIYAIIPGYQSPVSARDAALEMGAGAAPGVGQAVYLSGVPGLPDGVYTLLPARYATLPGAYRVVQNTGVSDPVPGASATSPDGSHIVTGYFTDTLTGAHDARASSFTVQSADTWGQYSEYSLTSASTYFTDQANANGTVVPRLGADAGRLSIAATAALNLGATLDAAAATGGRGSQVDIAGDAIQILGAGETARDGYLHVSADELSTLGAGSLLIGGKRASTDAGDIVDVLAQNVLLSNDAAHPLQGSEIILVANGQGGVSLGDGSVLRATATDETDSPALIIGQKGTDTTPTVSGDGALLRVSGLDAVPVVRSQITGLDGPAGTPGGSLVIGQGATIEAANSISLDATGLTSLAADATLQSHAIDVTANRIGLMGTDSTAADNAGDLLIGPRILAQFANSDETTLRGRQAIDLMGDAVLSVSHALALSAPTIHSDGGQAVLTANSLTIENDTGADADATASATGAGQLQVNVNELRLGSGNTVFSGLGQLTANVASGVRALGVGTIDAGSATIDMTTPVVTAATRSDNRLETTGDMRLETTGQAAASFADTGGKLSLQAGSIDVDTRIVSPGGGISLHGTQDGVHLGDHAVLDVAGIVLPFIDTAVVVPGGTVTLQADAGDVVTSVGSSIDVSGPDAGASSGSAGTLNISAPQGSAVLSGALIGHAAKGFLGGVLSLDTAGAVDLGSLAALANAGGMNGSVSVRTSSGDLSIAQGQMLRAHVVNLTADGGDVNVAGDIDASGSFGGTIKLIGARGVDIDGGLNTSASAAGKDGGDIAIGTSGTADGQLDPTFGYEVVQRADAGHIRIGSGARIVQTGTDADGKLYLRAPVLSDGDVPVDIAPGLDLSHSGATSLEAYVAWDSRDTVNDASKHFDGLVDAAGWFEADPVTGRPTLVAGTFTDDAGTVMAAPDPADAVQVADYLARYRFTPDTIDTAHATFYGYVNGDEAQGPGTLMSFIENPGFTFESRLKGAVPSLLVRPGVELRNSDADLNGGAISVLTNWNLGAGTRDADGTLHLAYRYGDQAPALTLRAEGDLDIRASITDGFFQQGSAGGVGGAAPESDQAEAKTWYDTIVSQGNGADQIDGVFAKPEDFADGDSEAVKQYYGQYVEYAKYLTTSIDEFSTPFNPISPATIISFGIGFGLIDPTVEAPAALPTPTTLNEFPSYLNAYKNYLLTSARSTDFVDTFSVPNDFVTLAGPPTTLDLITPTAAPVDNSPSPHGVAGNPLPILSATLTGGGSSTYRLTAGANLVSSDPGATLAGAAGSVLLGGHTDYTDPETNRVLTAPTVVRTGTGDIEIAASGDIRWTDDRAPAAVYTAGAPAQGTTADGSASLLQPSTNTGLFQSATPELVITGPVNPDHAGHVQLRAGGDIDGIQNTVDTTGDITGTAGTSTAQYWWPWMQTGNSDTRSSISFGAFDQGILSAGGNVSVQAGGDIRQLSVSLPMTWAIDTDASGVKSLQTFGGGDLDVRAGGDILSGSYFVARGTGTIQAGGQIGSDFSVAYTTPLSRPATMPVSTLIAMQDSQVSVQGGGSVSLGGVFNPSLLDDGGVSALAAAGHLDRQNYSSASRIDVISLSGDLTYGDLASPISLFAPGLGATSGSGIFDTAGDLLPASVRFAAANGDLSLLTSGELFPSVDGELGLLAHGNVSFDTANLGQTTRLAWGMIDAPLSSLVSPLNLNVLGITTGASAPPRGYLLNQTSTDPTSQTSFHAAEPWHADDTDPVRVYALDGDIVNGTGGGANGVFLMPNKVAHIEAGRDIVDLAYLGQQLHGADISVVKAGRDIIDTPLATLQTAGEAGTTLAVIAQAGPGYLSVEAGRNLGRLASQTELNDAQLGFTGLLAPAGGGAYTGIDSVGNIYNPTLPGEGASIVVGYGVAPGVDDAAFIAHYIDPAAIKVPGLDDGSASLVAFVENYDAGLPVDTGLAADRHVPVYTVDQAWARFQALPDDAKAIFVQQKLFDVLAQVGKDYNDASSPFANQYVRGYEALNTLFPAALGYTANGLVGGTNGAQTTISTGDLDIRGSTIQTQRGGDVSILAPGGEALLGSASAPPVIIDPKTGNVIAGPNTQGILTLQKGDVSIFTDQSVLLAQSRIFTEQGGDVTIWSSNGDINAGKGAKTNSEIPPVRYVCSIDAWCSQDAAGQVSGAGIATLQTVPDAPDGSVYLMAPRGTVDAGDAGIRVSGNLVIAAAHVANADNVQVKGDSVGLPAVQAVNVGALNAASSAATAATKVAEDVARQQQSDARDRQPSIISVQVIGSDPSASIDNGLRGSGYDGTSPVQVVRRAGVAGDGLTSAERARLLR